MLKHAIETPTSQANDVKWDRDNAIFADILLRADQPDHHHHNHHHNHHNHNHHNELKKFSVRSVMISSSENLLSCV